uniref:Adhesion G-protein coupled receptor G7 n=2 Tax=Ornithorhynchus anatinus TaxID=9258 RepID=F7CIA1_ORNAN
MPFCFSFDPKARLGTVFGILTTIILGLSIWKIVCFLNTEEQDNAPHWYCRNGGSWEEEKCKCPKEWTGERCEKVNFCRQSFIDGLNFSRITAGNSGYSVQMCENGSANVGSPKAVRACIITENQTLKLGNVSVLDCSQNLLLLQENTSGELLWNMSMSTQVLTFNSSALSQEEINSATIIVEHIFTSENAVAEAKETAVTTVSQLLNASKTAFERSENESFQSLIKGLSEYSLDLEKDEAVVQPNIAVQSVKMPWSDSNVLLNVGKNRFQNTLSLNTSADSLMPSHSTDLQVLISVAKKHEKTSHKVGFVLYENDKLFQANNLPEELNYNKRVISAADQRKNATVEMVIKPQFNKRMFQLNNYACVFWNLTTNVWETRGCEKRSVHEGFLQCYCNHTTNFAILMNFKKNYHYPKALDILSHIGSGLSICSLVFTIIFKIVTRKTRKTSVTWVFVSLCMSMLIFNLLFLFGIENSNKDLANVAESSKIFQRNKANEPINEDIQDPENAVCTVVAALLHYFLLVTFMWTGLNAVQLYFLLLRTIKPLPSHFTQILSLIAWGVPAIVVAITLGIAYSGDKGGALYYRKEEFCWLAGIEDGPPGEKNRLGIRSPMLWSFLLPVTIILINNTVIFIIITVNVLWKENHNLTKTYKASAMKKALRTLSVAMIFGITWILGYLMMVANDGMTTVFSYAFCIFNTTQGLQIFVFHTVKTKIFQDKASELFKTVSACTMKLRSLSWTEQLHLKVKSYDIVKAFSSRKYRFRTFTSSPTTEESVLSGNYLSFSS